MRIVLGIEYDGSGFCGWQKQPGLSTVQGNLENALSKIADEQIEIICAGRTDAGVHAINQIVHFDTNVKRDIRAWVMGTHAYLSPGISVHGSQEVDELFHARFSALSRCYQYVIYNCSTRPAILSKKVTWYYEQLNVDNMQIAAEYLLGENDFSSFRSSGCQSKTVMRNIHKIKVIRKDNFVIIEVQANAFLHHMVRNIVGVLKKIGAGLATPSWAKEVLEAKDRRLAANTASPDGLYLVKVEYPEKYQILTRKSPLLFL